MSEVKEEIVEEPVIAEPMPAPVEEAPPIPEDIPVGGTVDVVGHVPEAPVPQQAFALQGPTTPVDTATFLKQQDNDWRNDLESGHIEPKTYADMFGKKDTAGKIGTLFGLLVSGMGAGLSGKDNAVLKMMDKEIDNDFEAQKQSKTNAQNFIKMNQEHQLQEYQKGLVGAQAMETSADAKIKADALAHMQSNRAAFHNLSVQVQKLAAAAAADPTNVAKQQQFQKAQQALGIVGQAIDEKNSNIADKAAATSALLGGLNQAANPTPDQDFQTRQQGFIASGNPALKALAEDDAQKYVPGLGKAVIPLSGGDRDQINKGIVFQDQLKRFMDWTAKHSGELSPSERNTGMTLASGLQNAYREASNGGVYKSGEQDFISGIIDSTPSKFFNSIRVMPKLQAVQKDSSSQFNTMLKSKGLPNYQGKGEKSAGKKDQKSEAKASGPKDGDTAVSKSGKPIIFKNGKWSYK